MVQETDPLEKRFKAHHFGQYGLSSCTWQQIFAPPYPINIKGYVIYDTGRLVTRPAVFFADDEVGQGGV